MTSSADLFTSHSNLPGLAWVEGALTMPLVELPVRSTLVEAGDKTVLFSPLPTIEQIAQDIQSTYNVTDIVAPNLFHHLGLTGAKAQFPSARMWGPPQLSLKQPELEYELLQQETWPYQTELEMFPVDGMPKMNEHVWFHRETKTLLCTDLCFNIKDPKGLGAWFLFSVFGTYKQFGISRLFKMLVKDRSAFEASLKPILELPIENIIMAHGDVVIGNGQETLRAALHARGLRI